MRSPCLQLPPWRMMLSGIRRRGARRRARGTLAVFVAASLCEIFAAPARGEEESEVPEQVINELFLGNAVTTQQALELQVTSGVAWTRQGRHVDLTVPLETELGLTDRLQIGVEVPVAFVRSSAGAVTGGIGNVEAAALYSAFYARSWDLACTVGAELGLPAGSDKLGDETVSIAPLFIAEKAFGRLHANTSFSVEIGLPDDGAQEGTTVSPIGTLSLFGPIGQVVPTLELRGELGEERELSAAVGAAWHPAPDWELGAALVARNTGRAASCGILLTASFEVELGNGDPDEKLSTGAAR